MSPILCADRMKHFCKRADKMMYSISVVLDVLEQSRVISKLIRKFPYYYLDNLKVARFYMIMKSTEFWNVTPYTLVKFTDVCLLLDAA
jgi:hypothetical protein